MRRNRHGKLVNLWELERGLDYGKKPDPNADPTPEQERERKARLSAELAAKYPPRAAGDSALLVEFGSADE